MNDTVTDERLAAELSNLETSARPDKRFYAECIRELQRLRPDARRYQFLRSEEVSTDPEYYPFWEEFNAKLCRLDRLDALIDSAMGEKP